MPALWLLAACCALVPVPGDAAQELKINLPPFVTYQLDNGMSVRLMERHQLPLVNFVWIMKSGGGICDPAGGEGMASLTVQLLRQGTANRTAAQISEQLDFVGGSFQAGASHDYASGSAEFVSKDAALAVDLLADLLCHPVFPEEEVSKLIKQEVDGIAEAKEVPNEVLDRYYRRVLFGAHPYGRPVSGTETSLPRITREQLVKFYQAQYVPGQLILSAVGDFKAEEMRRQLAAAFGGWKAREAMVPVLKPPQATPGNHVLLVEKPDATQTFFRLGSVGLARTSPDWIPLQVVNTLFGGRFTSMINTALRIDSGLTYGAKSGFSSSLVAGEFFIGSFTKNETTGPALAKTLEVLRSLHEKGVTDEQLRSAKNYLEGQFGPTLETNDQLAGALAELAFFGLTPEYLTTYLERVEAVTPEDARRLIREHYPLENLSVVLIGQGSVIEPVAAKLGKDIQKKSITEPGF